MFKQNWRQIQKKCGRWPKWKEPEGSQMLFIMIKRRGSTFFLIAQPKVHLTAEIFVTTVKDKRQGKSGNRTVTQLMRQLPWALNFYRKNNTESCKELECLTQKHQVG